ncbi:MAG: hypothetical protein ACJ72R_00055 [Nitrososphaeraceae archaeon]
MTFKDIKRRVSLEVAQQHAKPFGRLRNKPLWIWDQKQHPM